MDQDLYRILTFVDRPSKPTQHCCYAGKYASILASDDVGKKNCSSMTRLAVAGTSGKFKWGVTET